MNRGGYDVNGNRRIFYDISTGNKIHEIGRNGSFVLPTIEQDIATYTILSERNRETFDVLELPYNQYAQDFAECNGYRVNIEKLATLPDDRKHEALEFSYPDPNEPEAEPVYQRPLSEQVNELERKIEIQNQAIAEMTLLMTMGGM